MAEYPENIIENLEKEHKIYTINGLEIAKSLGNSKVLNSVVLGLSAKHIGFKEEDWLAVIEKTVPPKTIELNSTEESFLHREDKLTSDMTIENMYDATKGRVSYEQATSLVKKIFYLSKSKGRAREFSEILNKITDNNAIKTISLTFNINIPNIN